MKKFILLLSFCTVLTLIGCNDKKDSYNGTAITLKDGEKWPVQPDMLEHIYSMETAVNDYKGGDTEILRNTLKENIAALTSKCTMQGQAHDELHKWLMPLIKMSEEPDKDGNAERLKEHFIVFHTYFK